MDVHGLAEALGVSEKTIYEWVATVAGFPRYQLSATAYRFVTTEVLGFIRDNPHVMVEAARTRSLRPSKAGKKPPQKDSEGNSP